MTQLHELLPNLYAYNVPMDAGKITLRSAKDFSSTISFYNKWNNKETIEIIPPGNWSIICCSATAMEADAAKVVDSNAWGWEKYLSVKNKKEQLNMLIRSKGLDDKLNWLILKLD